MINTVLNLCFTQSIQSSLMLFYTDSQGSVHVSSIVKGSEPQMAEITSWINEYLVDTNHFDLTHDHTVRPESSFAENKHRFEGLGYSVWDVENDPTVMFKIKFVQRN